MNIIFRFLLLVFSFFAIAQILSAQSTKTEIQLIKFDSIEHDYGNIEEANTPRAEHTFKFKNISDGPVKVTEAKPSCGCTTPSWSQDPIRRASDGFVMASYDPKNRPGKFEKSIIVRVAKFNLAKNEADTVDVQTIVLKIKGEVIPKPKTALDIYKFEEGNLRFLNNNFSFGTIGKKGIKTRNVSIYNAGNKPVKIERVESKPYLTLTFKDEKMTINSKDSIHATIKYDLDATPEYEWQNERIFLFTNDDSIPKKTIYVNATLLPDFSGLSKQDSINAPIIKFENLSQDVGALERGKAKQVEFKLKNNGKQNLEILKLKTSCACITFDNKVSPIPPNGTGIIKATFKAEGIMKGEVNKTIKVMSNDPKSSFITLGIRAEIKEVEKEIEKKEPEKKN